MIQKLQDIIDNEEKQHDTGWTVQKNQDNYTTKPEKN